MQLNSAWISFAVGFAVAVGLLAFMDYSPQQLPPQSQPTFIPTNTAGESQQSTPSIQPIPFVEEIKQITGQQEQQSGSVYNYGCKGTGTVQFTAPPRKIGDISMIEPLGLMSSNHVTPTDHQYYYPSVWTQELSEESMRDVYAPADAVVTTIGSMPSYFSMGKGTQYGDYRLIMHFTCDFYAIYIHVNQLSDKLKNAIGSRENVASAVEVKAGEYIGRARAFDFSVHHEKSVLSGFVVPEHYSREPWKIHTVDPFDYFTPEVKSQLLAKNIRTDVPLGGKIDRDIDGKLAGNWFEENTNGYQGNRQPEYWVTHVSFSPNARDEDHFIISLGDFAGEAKQFGAKGNTPAPKSVGVETGMVKYELVDFDYLDESGKSWNRLSYVKGLRAVNWDEVKGVVLVQLLGKRKLKLEVFPGKKASDVSGFTSSAKTYER